MSKVLLHICCGPCAIHPIQLLRQEGLDVEGFFYNPNIHPFPEYKKRFEAAAMVVDRIGINLIHHRYDIENFLRSICASSDRSVQHMLCWRMRLEETALIAKQRNIEYFSTTLLSSPYQDVDKIKSSGLELAEKHGVQFLPRNFRSTFADSHKIAREWQLYHQNYCGCIFSEKESMERQTMRKEKDVDCKPGKKKILIVDDEGDALFALESILKRAGFDVLRASNGKQALEKMNEDIFDLVFLDIYLPGMSGIEIFRKLKSIKPDTKVCLMTGWPKGIEAHYEDHLSLLREGAEDKMLRKPFGKEEVLRAVKEIIGHD